MSLQLSTVQYSDLSDDKNEKLNKTLVPVMAIAGYTILLSISQVPGTRSTAATARSAGDKELR